MPNGKDHPWEKVELVWLKCDGGECVEVSIDPVFDEVLVRSSLHPNKVTRFTAAEWNDFLYAVRTTPKFDLVNLRMASDAKNEIADAFTLPPEML